MSADNFPKLDGAVLTDEASRRQFSIDIARNIERLPQAVVRPVSVSDVVKTLEHANRTGAKVAVRGQGHSRYGQTLAGGGIVIDSSTLNRVTLAGASVDAQAGALWGEVFGATLAHGLTPPVLGTCPKLSVGGILSAGGFSNSSHIHGGIVDTVEELEVVTGDGRLITCSPQNNAELFYMVLAGMGQCAVIMRARIRLLPAPATVVRQDLFYDDLDSFLDDGRRLVTERGFDHITSRATERADGRWIFSINVGRFYGHHQEPEWTLAPTTSGKDRLGFQNKSEPVRASYRDYLMRESAKNAADSLAREMMPRREPSLTLFVPWSKTKPFVSELLANPAEMAGLADFQFNPFHVRMTRCPLFKFPGEEVAYMVWLYPRNTPLADDAAYEKVMEINRRILARMRTIGGKAYPPYAPYFSQQEWQEHYGAETWRRLKTAKEQYDPGRVLAPEMRMFDAGRSVE
jgi:cytokinin dehydrogenase